MLPFGVTIPATVPQRSEIPEGLMNYSVYIKKCKSVPLQAWSGPEGSRKLRFPDFMTTAQEGGKVVSLTHRPHLPPRNPGMSEAESTSGP